MRDLVASTPCPACGAWPGEPCRTLYTKDGSPPGQPFAGHHMARCHLWHSIRNIREGLPAKTGRLRRGSVAGCYYDIHFHDDEGAVVHQERDRVRERVRERRLHVLVCYKGAR